MSENNKNGISQSNILFSIINESTRVLTELCKTLESIKDGLEKISDHTHCEENFMKETRENMKVLKTIVIWGVIINISTFIALALSGIVPSWLLRLFIKFVPGLN